FDEQLGVEPSQELRALEQAILRQNFPPLTLPAMNRRQPDGIETTNAAFAAALELGDAKAASAAYTDNARLLPPEAELFEGRGAIEAFGRAEIDAGLMRIQIETLLLERHECLAYEIGRYSVRLRPDGEDDAVNRGKYLLVHERQPDGSWRRAVEMFNPEKVP